MKLFLLSVFAGLALFVTSAQAKAASGSISLDQPSPALGDTVTFTWSASGLHGNQDPRIQVVCYQGADLVYGAAYAAGTPFLLGGGSSLWLERGGTAHCIATLYYWDFHPVQTFVELASVEFDAAG